MALPCCDRGKNHAWTVPLFFRSVRRGKTDGGGAVPFITMNIRQTMYKIQTALNLSGRRIKINQFQSWSEQQKRMVTKYVITENGATIIESYHAAEVVQTLAELLQGGD